MHNRYNTFCIASMILLFVLISFQGMSFGGAFPKLEYGYINNAGDGVTPNGAPYYLYVLGQNKHFSGSVGFDDYSHPLANPNIWAGFVQFGFNNGPNAGETHVVVVEKEVSTVGYYTVTSKTLTNVDMANPNGISFVTANLRKMTAPTGTSNADSISLNINHTAPNADALDIWGYKIYRSLDGGAYSPVNKINGVSTSDVTVAQCGNFSVSANIGHQYKYKYKVIFRNKEYVSVKYSQESAILQPTSNANYVEAPGTVLTFDNVGGGDNTYIISVPYDLNSAGLIHAADLMNKLNRIGEGGVTGQYVTQVMKFKPDHGIGEDSFELFYWNQIIGVGGYDFDLVNGESYTIVVSSTVTHNISGNFPESFQLTINNTVENEQFVSLPYDLVGPGEKYATMEDLFKKVNNIADVNAINPADIEVTRVYTYNPALMDWDVAYWNPLLGFQNGNIPMVSGYGYVFTVNMLTAPPYSWNPQN